MLSHVIFNSRQMNNVKRSLMILPAVFLLASCDLAANYNKADRAANAETQDFRDALAERTPPLDDQDSAKESGSGDSIPSLEPYVSTEASGLKPMPLVSISINQSVPLRDALFEMAQQAGYDIELDPRIKGSVIFTARNRPFDEVIQRICEMSGLRYKLDDNSLRVELDEPYNKTYKIDYLSLIRKNTGSVSTNMSVVSGGGADTGSTYSVNSESTSDFWTELELNLKQLLGGASTGAMKTKVDPRITSVEKKSKNDSKDDKSDGSDKKDKNDKNKDKENKKEDSQNEEEPEAVLHVDSLPVDGSAENEDDKDKKDNAATFTLNKQAGILNVYATEKTQKEVEAYLKELRKAVTSQVLIEAKIFEVGLKDEYITGIDWGVLGLAKGEGFGGFLSTAASTTFSDMLAHPGKGFPQAPPSSAAIVNGSNLTIGYAGDDVQALVTAISGFGTVRALASPRLTVLNNQSAVLNVATNKVYFELDVNSNVDNNNGGTTRTTEVDSTIKSVPEGVLINVQPSINLDNRTIALSVRPTVSRITGTKSDPAVAFVVANVPEAAGIQSNIPELNVQEIDTVVQVRSGQAIVMGGLLQDRTDSKREGVPVLGELPVFGAAFRKHNDLVQKTELVIFIKATMLDAPEDTVDDTDKDLYRKFSGDRRPLKL